MKKSLKQFTTIYIIAHFFLFSLYLLYSAWTSWERILLNPFELHWIINSGDNCAAVCSSELLWNHRTNGKLPLNNVYAFLPTTSPVLHLLVLRLVSGPASALCGYESPWYFVVGGIGLLIGHKHTLALIQGTVLQLQTLETIYKGPCLGKATFSAAISVRVENYHPSAVALSGGR